MPRYIDADALRDALYDADAITMKGVRILNQFPTISPDEVRGVGEWLTEYEPNGRPYQLHCSVCDSDFSQMGITHASNYCPSCGAKMEVSEDA